MTIFFFGHNTLSLGGKLYCKTKNKLLTLNHSEDIKSSISETNFLSKILALVLDTLQKAVSSGVNFTFVVFSYA